MATVVLTESALMKEQGIRGAKQIEWVKVVADSSTTGEGAAYTFKKVRNVGIVVSAGPFSVVIDNDLKTATITPVITLSGTYAIGLVSA
jgi:hypothetical protein